jgi:hypothetical protein
VIAQMTDNPPVRKDPIGDKYFKPLIIAERWSDISFYAAALFSFAALLVEKAEYPAFYDVVQIAFVLAVLLVFASGILIRLYWRPNAEDKRRAELITNAAHVSLTVDRTEGYYNNDETDPTRRLGVMLLENSHFSKSVALAMLSRERLRVALYLVLFSIAVLYRRTDLAFAATAAQAIFSEQLLSRWLRLEWLRTRFETVYRELYGLFQSRPTRAVLYARILELFGIYETSKSNAGVALSPRIFFQRNAVLSVEWEQIKKALKL